MKVIARIQNDFTSKFGVPRQSGIIADLQSIIVFEPEFRNPETLRGLEQFSHIWLIWEFSENKHNEWTPTVRPPRLGGNKRMGVFATRSPYRPNPLGLSSVKLDSIAQNPKYGTVLRVSGADLMNGTPIYDIKPYVPYTDAHTEAACGFAPQGQDHRLNVVCPPYILSQFSETQQKNLLCILANDPRPTYQHDPERVYGLTFAGVDVHFTVDGNVLKVLP